MLFILPLACIGSVAGQLNDIKHNFGKIDAKDMEYRSIDDRKYGGQSDVSIV